MSEPKRALPVVSVADVFDMKSSEMSPFNVERMLVSRGIRREVYDFINYNLGPGAALAACLVGAPVEPRPASGKCKCE